MTKISITQLNDGFVFECSGHSGFAEKGSDIVCAGVSALCIALVSRLDTLSGENILKINTCHIADGELCIEVQFTDDNFCRLKALEVLETVRAGMIALEEMYPEYVYAE